MNIALSDELREFRTENGQLRLIKSNAVGVMQPSVDTREVRRPLGRGRGIAMLGAAGLKPAPGASVLVSPVDAQGVSCPLGRGWVIVMLIATLSHVSRSS